MIWSEYSHTIAMLTVGFAIACEPADDLSTGQSQPTHTIDPDFSIGLVEGDSAYLFGDIVSVAVDAAGRVYVGDRIGATVRVYDDTGRYVDRIAREGEGPGEIYGWPADITTGPGDRIYVRDGQRITTFAPTKPGGIADSVVATWRLPGYGNLSSTRSRVGTSGEYFYPGTRFRNDEPPRFFYLLFREGSPTGDTLNVPAYPGLTGQRRAFYRINAGSGRLLDGLSHVPFAAVPVWDVTDRGTVLSSTGRRDTLIETGIGNDTVRVIAGPTTGVIDVPTAEHADSTRALDARLDSLPVPIDEVIGLGDGVRERRLPTTLPAIIGIHIGTDGSIWIERWPTEGQSQSRFYDVLDSDGRPRARVVLQAALMRDPPPFFGTSFIAGIVRDADTGVQRVVRFSIPKN